MTEEFPQYGNLRQSEYFFLKSPDRHYRLLVPRKCIQGIIDIIESPQGKREHEISYGHIPGLGQIRHISTGALNHLLTLAEDEGWIE